jgi:hypothetical protein
MRVSFFASPTGGHIGAVFDAGIAGENEAGETVALLTPGQARELAAALTRQADVAEANDFYCGRELG